MKNKNGYTLMELIVVVALIAIIVVGGTSLFLSNIRSGGVSEVVLKVSKTGRGLVDLIETKLRYSNVVMVGEKDREGCLLAGESGVSSTNITYTNLGGEQEYIELQNERIASSSGVDSEPVFLNSDEVKIKNFLIQWFCVSGINDKIIIDVTLSGSGVGVGLDLEQTVSREIVLLNSGKI